MALIAVLPLQNGLNRAYCSVSARLKMPFVMFISIFVLRPEGQNWNPVKQRILNASSISQNQLSSSTISQS